MKNQKLDLIQVTDKPLNAETPLSALRHAVTPSNLVYVRNHFDIPEIEASEWRLKVGGAVDEPSAFSLRQIQDLSPFQDFGRHFGVRWKRSRKHESCAKRNPVASWGGKRGPFHGNTRFQPVPE